MYIDLPLWRDDPWAQGPGAGPCGPGGELATTGGPECSEDPCTSTSSTSTTPQVTPTNSLKRPSNRRRTDVVLYGCGALLASLALGYDLREALRGPEEAGEPQREEKKKKEGLFQRATRFRRSTSPPGGRAPRKEEPASGHSPGYAPGPVNLVSMSAIVEGHASSGLLRTGGSGGADRDPGGSRETPDAVAEAERQQDTAAARTQSQPPAQTPSPAPEPRHPVPGLRLRRKKSSSTSPSSE